MSKLVQCMKGMKDVFDEYSMGQKTLQKDQLAKLLRKEFGFVNSTPEEMKNVFETLDADRSNSVDFKEYVAFVAALSPVICE